MRVDIVSCISMLCNLRCRNCDVYPMLGNPTQMSLDQIERMFVNVHAHFRRLNGPQHINFQWYGGEPLLIPPNTYREIFEVQRRVFDRSRYYITNTVQSNFTVMDEDRIALLHDHFNGVGVSLDLLTNLRVNAAGICQQPRVLANLDRVRDAGIDVSGVTVLTRLNLSRMSEIYQFYRDRRMKFRMLPLEHGLYPPGQDFEVTPRETLVALCTLADEWLSDSNPVQIEPLGRYLFLVRHMLLNRLNRVGLYDREEWMPILLVSTDGTVRGYGDRFEEALGNIFEMSLAMIFVSPQFRASAQTARSRMQKTCVDCPYLGRACPGDPVAEGQQDFAELDESGNLRCVVARGLIEHLEYRLQRDRGSVYGPIGDAVLAPYGMFAVAS